MKKIFVLLIFISLVSCEELKICTDEIKGKPENNLIVESDFNTVKSLFSTNGLSLDNFLVYRLQKDELGYKHVRCYQYVNNLQVFSDDVIFHFNAQNKYYFLSGETINGIDISSDPNMNRSEAVELFLKTADEDGRYTRNSLKDECFQCEIGYYDLNAGISYASHNFRLAWKIKCEDSDFPFAYINDTDKSMIYYDNGIRY
jgi:Zn-dependent metalloprotease